MSHWTKSGRNWRDAGADPTRQVEINSRLGPGLNTEGALTSELSFIRFDR